MKKKTEKTNVMRLLEQKKILYESYEYEAKEALSGKEVATILSQNPHQVFKTLVTVGNTKTHYVFMIPVHKELDLKKAAKAVGEKSISMIKSKELLPLTGYVHGGCSPIGMKKQFQTVVDISAQEFETIFFSGGKIGFQVQVALAELSKIVKFAFHDIVEEI